MRFRISPCLSSLMNNFFGKFDINRTPLAPPGIKVVL
jgi:hypothetical protein